MATRPVFVSNSYLPYVKSIETNFKFYSGFALSQARKSVDSLHSSFTSDHPEYEGLVLEISSKSDNPLGVHLSAFNLMYMMTDGRKSFVENVFQAGKCFSEGGPYTEILEMTAAEAKHFQLLRTSGDIIKFQLEGVDYPKEPKTFFYDWVYINALNQNQELGDEVIKYRAFTDIAFNPQKSINCQARSVALYVALKENGLLEEAISSPEKFMTLAFDTKEKQIEKNTEMAQQLSMF